MEPSNNASGNFQFSIENLEQIPHPDDSSHLDDDHSKNRNVAASPNGVELPSLSQHLFSKKSSKSYSDSSADALSSLDSPNSFIPPMPPDKDKDILDTSDIPLPKNFDDELNNITLPESMPPLPSLTNNKRNDYTAQEETKLSISDCNIECDQDENIDSKSCIDDNKYSPSKVESDEENQDFATAKPKVLGKEQAKKRLMAFSLTKLSNSSTKKQSKVINSFKTIKEKPPNPNKSSGVQEQFRATISEIEEEKRKMMKNMPSYLLLEMNDLVKSSNVVIKPSTVQLDKGKSENSDLGSKDCSADKSNISKSKDYLKNNEKKKSQRSRSRSRNRSRSRSRSRSRHRSKKRRKSRSSSKSRRRSKSVDNGNIKSEKLAEDWKSLKKSGFNVDEFVNLKFDVEETEKPNFGSKRRYSKEKSDFKPNFNYLKTYSKTMRLFRAKPADSRVEDSNLYSEKTIKYTTAKPMIIWSENPSCATDFYMPRNMLLENCDTSRASIFQCIISSKNDDPKASNTNEIKFQQKNRAWYPSTDFLMSSQFNLNEKVKRNGQGGESFIDESEFSLNPLFKEEKEEEKQSLSNADKKVTNGQDSKTGKRDSSQKRGQNHSLEKQISLVNDSYMSDDERDSSKIKEMIVGDVKVQVDLDLNSVKVPSKWDSDYENENFEKHSASCKEVDMEIASLDEDVSIYSGATAEKSFANEYLNNTEFPPNENFGRTKTSENINFKNDKGDTTSQKQVDAKTENLASEYEEFLKMVSFDNSYNTSFSTNDKLTADIMKSDKQKNTSSGTDLKKSKLENTDWDKESDHEEISTSKISKKTIDSNSFLAAAAEEKPISFKKEAKKKLATKKKTKTKKNKKLKKPSKTRKKKYDSSSSSDSSSDSYDSESDSDSDDTKSRKKKKKKVSKSQKKSKKDSSSESDTDSDSSTSSKDQNKKKSAEKKKKNRYGGDDKTQNALLKELDFKKQLIMKKIEAIDSISEKNEKKKEKNKKSRKMENSTGDDSDTQDTSKKSEKKKSKSGTSRKKSKSLSKSWDDNRDSIGGKSSSSESESDSENSTSKKKKLKKTGKKKRDSSESSESGEKLGNSKVDKLMKARKLIDIDKGIKKIKKTKKQKKRAYSSTESEENSSKSRKKMKKSRKKSIGPEDIMGKEKLAETAWQDNFLFEGEFKTENSTSCWDDTKLREKDTSKKYTNFTASKEKNDWEANSSFDESPQDKDDGNSSWDDEAPPKIIRASESTKEKEESKGANNFGDFKLNSGEDTFGKDAEAVRQEVPGISKSSMSNFSFNDNSFNSFEQDFSRNFLLHEPSFSNSAQFGDSRNLENCTIEARPFQSLSKSNLAPVHNKSELYSPGHSDSELSESEPHTKSEKINKDSHISKDEIYDPLNSDSEGSQKNTEVELSSIPLPSVSDILLPGELRTEDEDFTSPHKFNNSSGPELTPSKIQNYSSSNKLLIQQGEPKSTDFPSAQYFNSEDKVSIKKQVISMKPIQKLKSKAASVFQDESDEEIVEGIDKSAGTNTSQSEALEKRFLKSKNIDEESMMKNSDGSRELDDERNLLEEEKKSKKNDENDRRKNRQESKEKEIPRNSEKKDHLVATKNSTKSVSPIFRKSKTPELKFSLSKVAPQEIKSDCFEIEPLERNSDCKEDIETLQTIPVLTGFGIPASESTSWTRSHLPGYSCAEFTEERLAMMNNSESFDIYPSEDSKYRDSIFDKDCNDPYEDLGEKYSQKTEKSKRDKKKSRSRSLSPRKKRRSRSSDRRRSPKSRSPKRKSSSHKYRNESPYSPRKRSPKRKSPSRWHRNSRSPDRRRKSRSRSPSRKRRSSPFRRSRSFSPRKHRSPKRRGGDSPRRRDSQSRDLPYRESTSPRKDYSHLYSDSSLQNRIPVIGTSGDNDDVKLGSTLRGSPTGFSRHLTESGIAESDVNNGFYNREYLNEFGVSNYPCEVGLNNLITVKNHELEKGNSPERLSLDQRIELELGVPLNSGSQCQNEHYSMPNQGPFSDINPVHFPNSYSCDNNNSNNENFYQNQNVGVNPEFNGQFFNGHQQQLNYGSFQQFSNGQPIQNSVLQVGNIVEVVPTMQHSSIPPSSNLPSKSHQIMQVGNVLQVVPTQKSSQGSPENYGHPSTASPVPPVKTQKATAVVAPSSIVPPPNPEAIINPLIKAIQLEREKRKKEKEKRKAEREARRKARQLRREAKLMSVNEKLKKSVQDEGLMLGQEVDDDELLDALDLPTSPIPVEIITVSSPSTLPPAGKGILITAGFMQKPPSEKKEVKFADGICPGEGTSTSGGEDIVSPPPKAKLPKEKRYKKKKTKVKKKVKVQIIRQIIQEDGDDDDDLSPPPPPPGDPPPVFFARFPFASNAQFPVYHTQQTTTTTLTTIQYPTPAFQ